MASDPAAGEGQLAQHPQHAPRTPQQQPPPSSSAEPRQSYGPTGTLKKQPPISTFMTKKGAARPAATSGAAAAEDDDGEESDDEENSQPNEAAAALANASKRLKESTNARTDPLHDVLASQVPAAAAPSRLCRKGASAGASSAKQQGRGQAAAWQDRGQGDRGHCRRAGGRRRAPAMDG